MFKSWRKWCWCALLLLLAADTGAVCSALGATKAQTVARRRWSRRGQSRPTRSRQGYGHRYYGAPSYTGPSYREGGPEWTKYLDQPFYMRGERRSLGILP